MKSARWALALSVALVSSAAFAEGNAEAGKLKAYTCYGCHGIPNYNNAYPSYHVPKLAGQHPEYLAAALQEYKKGERKHPTMSAQAKSLSDQDIEDIAAYFSKAPGLK